MQLKIMEFMGMGGIVETNNPTYLASNTILMSIGFYD